MSTYVAARIAVEAISAAACFILVRFMIKPYRLTGESRYLGLPLGFIFLGLSYALATAIFSITTSFNPDFEWLALLIKTFAFVFLAVTYYFSNRLTKNVITWDITLGLLTVALFTLLISLIIDPQSAMQAYFASQLYVRIFNVLCLTFIAILTLRSHVKQPDPTTIWIPFGFILLGVSQYSLIFWYINNSLAAFTGSLAIRLMALAIFLFVAYQTFYRAGKGGSGDEDSSER
jgi:hypothetical protein